LLRVLQEREFERVGGGRTVSVDVRVIAATNRDLTAAVEGGTFRLDLFYRLNVFPVRAPSLRERKEDIPLLAKYFIERYARSAGKKIKNIGTKTLELLQAYDWPGNIRELQNVIERAVILCDGATLSIDESSMHHETLETLQTPTPLSEALTNREKAMIEAALEETGGRVSGPSGAAVKLGIPRTTLESRIRSLQINKHLFRSERPALSTGSAAPLRQVARRPWFRVTSGDGLDESSLQMRCKLNALSSSIPTIFGADSAARGNGMSQKILDSRLVLAEFVTLIENGSDVVAQRLVILPLGRETG
jgi:Sigma-54 interaction domain/Bacterial regulatory protein, Fis family